ncbi:MAG: PQQ-dependent sugar dehydrogenase [Phycisphaerae bacterium]
MRKLTGAVAALGLTVSAGWALAQTPITTARVIAPSASTPNRPIFVTAPPGVTDRIWVVEQRQAAPTTQARILVYQINGSSPYTLLSTFLTITGLSTGNEQGLLGLAFDPDYLTNGRFYLDYTDTAGTTIIQRRIDSNPLDNVHTDAAGSPENILTIAQPFSNHNGGWIAFDPTSVNKYLYIDMGDGGSGNDPSNNAQTGSTLLGKMLRIDVTNAPGYGIPPTNPFLAGTGDPGGTIRDEIWHFGMRNPWRSSFDRLTGGLYIGDVGQNAIEEIDYQAPNAGGQNFLWRCMEGASCTGLGGCTCITCNTVAGSAWLTPTCPITQYSHTLARCSITGGYVYRGPNIPDLQGTYFFADYCGNQIYSLVFNPAGGVLPTVTERTAAMDPDGGGAIGIGTITSFGEDNQGEMYIVDQGGEIFKIIVECDGGVPFNFSGQPSAQTLCVGGTINLSVGIAGARGAVSFQWMKGGVPIGGATNSSYSIPNAQVSDTGLYKCRVTDQCNQQDSNEVQVTVTPLPAGDIDGDCDVDATDVTLFENVLLGLDGDAQHTARSDLDGSTQANGDDIDEMVNILIP